MTPTVKLSDNGPVFSRLVIGAMKWGQWGHQLSPGQMLSLMERCVDLGVTTVDHADIYGDYTTESEFGKALSLKPALRQRMQLVSKCGIELQSPNRSQNRVKHYNTSKAYIIASLDETLRHLCTDYVDLLLIHRPSPLMDPDEIAEAFTRLHEDGKVLHFGASNFTPSQFEMLHSRIPLVTNQVRASVQYLEPFQDGTFDQCLRLGIAPMVWAPLGGGKLFTDSDNEQVQRIREMAEILSPGYNGATLEQLIIAWLLRHPARLLPIIGTGRIERVESILPAFDIQMSTEDWFLMWRASTGLDVA